jgi:hypothetical protein
MSVELLTEIMKEKKSVRSRIELSGATISIEKSLEDLPKLRVCTNSASRLRRKML